MKRLVRPLVLQYNTPTQSLDKTMADLREYVPSTTPGKTWSLCVGKHFDRVNYFTALEGTLSDVGSSMQSFQSTHGGSKSSRYIKEELDVKRLTAKVQAEAMAKGKQLMRLAGMIV